MNDQAWGRAVLDAAADAFGGRVLGAAFFIVDAVIDSATGLRRIARFRDLQVRGEAPRLRSNEEAYALHRDLPAPIQDKAFFGPSVATLASDALRDISGARRGDLRDNPIWEGSWQPTVGDAIGILAHDGASSTVVLSLAGPAGMVFHPPERRVWSRISSHVGAAYRLRRSPGRCEVILNSAGRIEHHEGMSHRQLTRVRELQARLWRARQAPSTDEQALDIWQGLCDGRWTLVDRIDTDGKVFVLAMRNEPGLDLRTTPLSAKQRAAVGLLSLGYSDKQIGYALGLTEGAVAMLLQRAKKAWNVRRRADLVRSFLRVLAQREPHHEA